MLVSVDVVADREREEEKRRTAACERGWGEGVVIEQLK